MSVQLRIASCQEHLPLIKSRAPERLCVHNIEFPFDDANMMVSKGEVVRETIAFLSFHCGFVKSTKSSAPGIHTHHRNPQIKLFLQGRWQLIFQFGGNQLSTISKFPIINTWCWWWSILPQWGGKESPNDEKPWVLRCTKVETAATVQFDSFRQLPII